MGAAIAFPTQDDAFRRQLITVVSCRISWLLDVAQGSAADDFISQAAKILEDTGAFLLRKEAGIEAQFESPETSETDAERAVLAALELLSASRKAPYSGKFTLRIGIASGLIWTKAGAAGSDDTFSNAVAIQASTLRESANPGFVYITEATRDFVKDLFEYADVEPIVLRKFSEPVRAFAVVRSSEEENRFEALHSQRLRFLGRTREVLALAELWRRASSGRGQVSFITGEKGIGKSRLAVEVERRLLPMPGARLRLFGTPKHQNSVLYPFLRLVWRLSGASLAEPLALKTMKFEALLDSLGLDHADESAGFASVRRLLSGDTVLPEGMNARKHRELILHAFLTMIAALARQSPVLMVFEDLQWADATSRELVGQIVKHCQDMPLMLIATARPEFIPAWASEKTVSAITLPPLSPQETSAFVSLVARNRDFPAALHDHIIECTGGVPLFVEELTKVLIETGLEFEAHGPKSGNLRSLLTALPISVHAALLARLEQVAEGKRAAQAASVLGRHFSLALLEGIAGISGAELDLGLARLTTSGLLLREGGTDPANYMFKHALVQEAAYSTLSAAERKTLHMRAARLLQTSPDHADGEPETIAYHLAGGGEYGEAASLWHLSGQHAAARSANVEAIEHLNAGLMCLRKLEGSPGRDARERLMLIELGTAQMAVHGFGAIEGDKAFRRAAALSDEATPVPQRLRILCGLWNVRNGRSELYEALPLAEQFFELAHAAGAGVTLGHCMMGQTLAAMGEFKRAQRHFLAVIQHHEGRGFEPGTVHFAADEHILALTYMGRVLWALGYPDQAAAAIDEALSRARNGADAFSAAIALGGQLCLATHGGSAEDMALSIHQAVAHCTQYNLHFFENWMLFNRGALLARQGEPGAGIQMMRAAIAGAEARQTRHFRVFQLSCIAEAHLRGGARGEALEVAQEAVHLAEVTGERWAEAGLRRVRAEILFELECPRDGWIELTTALALARRQCARLEELRVATAMTRYAGGKEEAATARSALRAVYEAFDEGLDLPDLRAARELLAVGKDQI
jgi:tetratricopeptide (TPR) repeat protein